MLSLHLINLILTFPQDQIISAFLRSYGITAVDHVITMPISTVTCYVC